MYSSFVTLKYIYRIARMSTYKDNSPTSQLVGVVEKTMFKSKENGYIVFQLKVSSTESVTVTGYLPDIHDGVRLSLMGKWSFHPKFGRQFAATSCEVNLPQSAVGIEKYLSSGLIKGIGPVFAKKLVAKFGDKTLDIIDTDPERLFEVPGVGKKRVEQIIRAWEDQREISKVMVFLQEREVSTAFAAKIYKNYGNQSIDVITHNPYRLIEDIWGVGFKMADTLALKLGFAPDSIFRIQAGLIYTLTQATQNGNLYKLVSEAKEETIEHLSLTSNNQDSLLKQALTELFQQDKIKLISYQDEHYIGLPQYYHSEKNIAHKVLKFKASKYKLAQLSDEFCDVDKIYQELREQKESKIFLNEDQQAGIISVLQNNISIITGGPGTGKTTLVKKLLDILDGLKVRVRLAAPTGRAAKRMFEGTGRNTETLHRLLEFNPQIMGFSRNENNALETDILIVDEASMIDVFLMNSLLKALPDRAHLVLLGDIDQLPSVGAGNILNDLIESEQVSVTRLTQIFRQAEDSLIIVNAHRVNKGEFPSARGLHENSKKDFFYIKKDEPEEIFGVLRKIYKQTLAIHKISKDNTVVLTPMNRGIAGTQRLNQELQEFLNSVDKSSEIKKKEITRFGTVYREGDRVMQVRNNYDKFVFNGDMGVISRIDQSDQELFVKFGERELSYNFAELNELVLAYAISIHKSQGSEFDAVIIPIFMQHFMLLQRNLVYTAITRAKKLCILVGQSRAIAMAIKNNKGTKRLTFLKEFLTSDLEAR